MFEFVANGGGDFGAKVFYGAHDFVVGQGADADLGHEALVAEELVLVEDLLRHFFGALPTTSAPRGERPTSNWRRPIGPQPRSRPMRFIIAA